MAGERSVAILETISQTSGFKESTADAKALDGAITGATLSTRELTKAEISLQGSLDRMDRALDPNIRALQEYERTQRLVARAEQQNAGTAEQRARILENSALRYQQAISRTGQAVNDNAKNYGLASHQIQNLSFQLNDLAVQIGSGQGLFRPLLQQGAQVLQILQMGEGGIRGSLMGLKDSLSKIGPAAVSGFGVAVTAAVGLTTALVSGIAAVNDYREQYNELQRVLTTGAGRQAGLKPGDVQGAAESAAAASRAAGGALSTSEARAVGLELAKTGKIGKEVMTDLMAESEAYAKTLGVDLPTAAKKLGGAFADPAKGAEMLGKELLTLSAAQVEQIGTLARMGDRAGATKILMQGLKDGVVDLKDQVLTATIVWERFKAAALNDADRVAKAIGQAAMPKTPEQRIQDIQALPGTGLGGQVTPEERQARSDAILKIQADASAKELEATRRAEEAKRNEYALTANTITESVNSSIVKFKELQAQSTALTEAMKHPELLADSAATADALNRVQTALGGATTAAQFYAVQLSLMKQQGDLALQSIYAQTQASLAQTDAERQAATVAQARVAQQQAELAARQAMQSQQQIEIAGQQAYNQVMAQANAQKQIAVQQSQQKIAQGQLEIQAILATTNAERAQIAAEQSLLETKNSLLPIEQRLAQAEQARAQVLAQETATLNQMIATQEGAIRLKKEEIKTLGMEDSVRQRRLGRIQAENELTSQGIDANSALGKEYISNAGRLGELNGKLNEATEAMNAAKNATDASSDAFNKNGQWVDALMPKWAELGQAAEDSVASFDAAGNALDRYGNRLDGLARKVEDNGQRIITGLGRILKAPFSMSDIMGLKWDTADKGFASGIAAGNAATFRTPTNTPIGTGTGGITGGMSLEDAEATQPWGRQVADIVRYGSVGARGGGSDVIKQHEEFASNQALMMGKSFYDAAVYAQKSSAAFQKARREGMNLADATEAAAKAMEELEPKVAAIDPIDLGQLGKPIEDKISALRGLQEKALSRTYRPDPYAEKNPDFFYSGERIFKEAQDKVYEGLQTQIVKLEGLQTTLSQLVNQGQSFPSAIVNAMVAAGFGDIAQQITTAFRSMPGAPASATPPSTAVQAGSVTTASGAAATMGVNSNWYNTGKPSFKV